MLASLHPVVKDYLVFATVLAKLKELPLQSPKGGPDRDQPSASGRVEKLFTGGDLGILLPLFEEDPSEGTGDQPDLRKLWRKYFRPSRKEKAEGFTSPFNSVYQCAAFFGLDAPANLTERLEKGLDPDTNITASKYDDAISQWGMAARAIVASNGGFLKFLSLPHLGSIVDLDARTLQPIQDESAPSLVPRLLALEKDRYLQVLVAPVGVLWPFWILRDARMIQILKAIFSQGGRKFQTKLSDAPSDLFLDISTKVGDFLGAPFPFGFAGAAVRLQGCEDLTAPWGPATTRHVVDALTGSLPPGEETPIGFSRTPLWSPPLLVSGRGDQWIRGPAQRLMYVAHACPVFSSAFRKGEGDSSPPQGYTVAVEEATWAHSVGEKLVAVNAEERLHVLSRKEIASADADLILTYFPADLAVRQKAEYSRIGSGEVCRFGPDGVLMLYTLSSTLLAGSPALSKQPRMAAALMALGKYLTALKELVADSSPSAEAIAEALDAREDREGALRVLEANVRPLQVDRQIDHQPLNPRLIPEAFRKAISLMAEALGEDPDAAKQYWPELLSYHEYTEVYFSQNVVDP